MYVGGGGTAGSGEFVVWQEDYLTLGSLMGILLSRMLSSRWAILQSQQF